MSDDGLKSPKERFSDPAFRSTQRWLSWHTDIPQKRGEDGYRVCRWCWGPVPTHRHSWCSPECVREAGIRATASSVHYYVRQRDHGICAECGLDTEKLREAVMGAITRPSRAGRSTILSRLGIGHERHHGEWWDAHHVLSVTEGGGCCGLENYKTLCLWCHKAVTASQSGARAAERKPKALVEQRGLFVV